VGEECDWSAAPTGCALGDVCYMTCRCLPPTPAP
jgi:hypothetical protein